jgi:hypothetical protein
MATEDSVIRAWPQKDNAKTAESPGDSREAVRLAPASAAQALAEEAERGGGPYAEAPEYKDSFGRTLFDGRSSEDGSVTVVFPADRVTDVPSQSLVRIVSVPDRREFLASVTSGPFCEPDAFRRRRRS